MDVRNLFILRYRSGSTGVITSYVTASSLVKAQEVGQWWCNQDMNRRFIRVEPAVIADESDLLPKPAEKADSGEKPKAEAKPKSNAA